MGRLMLLMVIILTALEVIWGQSRHKSGFYLARNSVREIGSYNELVKLQQQFQRTVQTAKAGGGPATKEQRYALGEVQALRKEILQQMGRTARKQKPSRAGLVWDELNRPYGYANKLNGWMNKVEKKSFAEDGLPLYTAKALLNATIQALVPENPLGAALTVLPGTGGVNRARLAGGALKVGQGAARVGKIGKGAAKVAANFGRRIISRAGRRY